MTKTKFLDEKVKRQNEFYLLKVTVPVNTTNLINRMLEIFCYHLENNLIVAFKYKEDLQKSKTFIDDYLTQNGWSPFSLQELTREEIQEINSQFSANEYLENDKFYLKFTY